MRKRLGGVHLVYSREWALSRERALPADLTAKSCLRQIRPSAEAQKNAEEGGNFELLEFGAYCQPCRRNLASPRDFFRGGLGMGRCEVG